MQDTPLHLTLTPKSCPSCPFYQEDSEDGGMCNLGGGTYVFGFRANTFEGVCPIEKGVTVTITPDRFQTDEE